MKWYIREGWTWVSVTGLGFVVAVVQFSYGSQGYSEPVQSHSWVGVLAACLLLGLCHVIEGFHRVDMTSGRSATLNTKLNSTWTFFNGTGSDVTVCNVVGTNNYTVSDSGLTGICNCTHSSLGFCNVSTKHEGSYDLRRRFDNGPEDVGTWFVVVK